MNYDKTAYTVFNDKNQIISGQEATIVYLSSIDKEYSQGSKKSFEPYKAKIIDGILVPPTLFVDNLGAYPLILVYSYKIEDGKKIVDKLLFS
jgi:hypothetical protein